MHQNTLLIEAKDFPERVAFCQEKENKKMKPPRKINLKKNLDMLSDKELKYLEDLEKNKDVIYLLNTRECELISRLIRSYKEIKRQLTAIQINKEE